MSNFPDSLDSDLELPRVDSNITEVDGVSINSLRDSIFNIQRVLGLTAQGDLQNLSSRLNVSINPDGTLSSTALATAGLVALPIDNADVGAAAAIAETKLDLDYSTQSLYNGIVSNDVDIDALQAGVALGGSNFSLHIAGTSNFHDGYQIKIDKLDPTARIAGLGSADVGSALNELAGMLFLGDLGVAHIDLTLPATVSHQSDYISVSTTNFTAIDAAATDVQSALDSVDVELLDQRALHLDGFHSDGILKDINSGDLYNPNQSRLTDEPVSYVLGASVIDFTSLSVSFASMGVRVGDILSLTTASDMGTYQVLNIGPMTSSETLGDIPVLSATELRVAHVFTTSETAVASVYGPASVSSKRAPLACSIRQLGTPVDSVTVLNPDAARAVSVGFNGVILNDLPSVADGYAIGLDVGFGGGVFRSITIPDLHLDRTGSARAIPVSSRSVAERINAYVSDPDLGLHFPISAAATGDELVISHSLVGTDYTLEILDGYTGNFALGLDSFGANVLDDVLVGNSGNIFSVNGSSISTLANRLTGTSSITTASVSFGINVSGSPVNPLGLGIVPGDIMHVTGHPTAAANGSYVLENVSSTQVTVYAADAIPAPTNPTEFSVLFTHANVSLESLGGAELANGLMQISVNEHGETVAHQRLEYTDTLGVAVSITSVSDGFPLGSSYTFSISTPAGAPTTREFNIIDASVAGATVSIHEDFEGAFGLYHSNGIDFVEVTVTAGAISTPVTSTFSVGGTLNSDETLDLCMVHFDGSTAITSLEDQRLFGTLAEGQIREDFVESFSRAPISDLRSDGVVDGFGLLDMSYIDSLTGMQALPLSGGVSYVQGTRVEVETQKVIVPSYSSYDVLIANQVFIIGINKLGSLYASMDELGEMLSDGYLSSAAYGRTLPLYEVTVTNGIISRVVDVRRFINNLDEKLELIVDETNNVVGNFRTLEGALLYAQKYPGAEKLTVKIVNAVYPARELVVPNGVSLLGEVPYGGSRHRIVNSNTLGVNFITLNGNNRVENLQIESDEVALNAPLLFLDGDNINVERCRITFTGTSPTANAEDLGIRVGVNALDNIRITNNRLDGVFSGIESTYGVANITVQDNEVTNLVGLGTEASGVKIGSTARAITSATISGNKISVPNAVSSSEIRGVFIDIGNTIYTARVSENNIIHDEATQDTMVDGIRVDNSAATGNILEHLFVTNNMVQGIALDTTNVSGIYINHVDAAQIDGNILKEIGFSALAGNAGIAIAATVAWANVTHNSIQDCVVSEGISALSTSQVSISNNRLHHLGATAIYIDGSSPRSKVHGNILTATSGFAGIRWSGIKTAITSNILSSSSGYSFSEYGIRATGNNSDISDNTIASMIEPSDTSIGIDVISSTASRVNNNTVEGTRMLALIALGAASLATGNILKGATATSYISIAGDNTSVMDNVMQGFGTNAIFATGVISDITVSGNSVSATVTNGINATAAAEWDVTSNRFPDAATNIVGPTATTSTTNTNLIGINRGMLDTISISMGEGVSAFSEDGGTYSHPHWSLDGQGATPAQEWVANTAISPTDDRKLFLPLSKMPNGARLVSVNISGNNVSGTLTVEIARREHGDTTSGGTATLAPGALSVNTGVYTGTTSVTGEVILTTPTVINHSVYSYYMIITSSGGATAPTVTSARAVIRY